MYCFVLFGFFPQHCVCGFHPYPSVHSHCCILFHWVNFILFGHLLIVLLEEVIERTWIQVDFQAGPLKLEAPHPCLSLNVHSACLPCANGTHP